MMTVLDIKDMRISAGGDGEDAFHLSVPDLFLRRGDCIAVSGPSGCGKSTLLEVLALLRRPDDVARFRLHPGAGRTPVDLNTGRDLSDLRQGPIGYVPQMGGVLPFLTARAQIDAVMYLAQANNLRPTRKRRDRFTEALGLLDHMNKRRTELSGGQRKRVALLAGLTVPRTLLIADEPTAGLDERAAARALHALSSVAAEEGSAVLIATHDVVAARFAGFTVMSIDNGRLAPTPIGKEAFRHDTSIA